MRAMSTAGITELPYLPITTRTRLRELDRCILMVWCVGDCRQGTRLPIDKLIARHGLDAKLADLAHRFRCRRCGGPGWVEVQRLAGVHRPVGDEPFYC